MPGRATERSGQPRAAAERDVAVDRTTLTAMLNGYRAMPFGGRDPCLVSAPMLDVWGVRDTALLRPTAEAAPRWVAGPLTCVELPGASHWLPEQNVDEVAPLLLRHLAAHRRRTRDRAPTRRTQIDDSPHPDRRLAVPRSTTRRARIDDSPYPR